MNTISNEQSNQAPFGAKNLAFAVSSGGVIWLCGKVSPILHSYYKDVPCHSPVQNPACATYTAAMVATTAMLILAVYGIAKAFVFDYHPGGRPFTLIKQQPNAEEVPQTKTNSFFEPPHG